MQASTFSCMTAFLAQMATQPQGGVLAHSQITTHAGYITANWLQYLCFSGVQLALYICLLATLKLYSVLQQQAQTMMKP